MSARPNALRARPAPALRGRPPAARILVIRLGAVGDVLRTLPAVAELRRLYPDAELTWLVEPAAADAAALSPAVDRVLVFPRPALSGALRGAHVLRLAAGLRAFVTRLRAPGFDLVLDFHGILKSGVLAWLCGCPTRLGYARPFAREGSWLLASHHAQIGADKRSRFARNADLVRCLGAAPAAGGDAPAVLAVPADARARIGAALGGARPGVVLHPGSSPHTPHKRWPADRFAALAGALARETGVPAQVVAGPAEGERALAAQVVERAGGAARHAPVTDGLGELAALLARAPLFVGGDSGPLHLASLVGTPVVQILGPTDPVENAPWPATPSRSVRVALPCSPCRRGCAEVACLDAVSVEAVADAARSLLRADGARQGAGARGARDGAGRGAGREAGPEGVRAGTWPPWRAA